MELFELLNEDGTKQGIVKEREAVHREGDLHGGSHVWVSRYSAKYKRIEILLQKRRFDKDAFPGCWDVSCAGHMDQGEDFITTAIREAGEELGLFIEKEDLDFLFSQLVEGKYVFHGKPFWNREVNHVFLLKKEVQGDMLNFQKEEIEMLEWQDAEHIKNELINNNPEYCIFLKEYMGLYEYLVNKYEGNKAGDE
ncbi:NUDIX hydrolase [Anaeromicropila populeti]|uniref:Isopentenyldiphosphate isomerase n=1 Tax=Anaeromicropila populeti TaxID=37658 RepID=A0A1I6JQH5_9FIRM|nr:NUDIX domain-containing protein [Anaeromicropila populeti]SFR81161.1 Isopentenyldiphosphate isomerase [Anaeromicropila populeti]